MATKKSAPTGIKTKPENILVSEFKDLPFDEAATIFAEIRGIMKEKIQVRAKEIDGSMVFLKEFCNNNSL